jgi:hypothetical protein
MPPNAILVSKLKLAVSGDTRELIGCADVTAGGTDMGSRSDRVIIKSAGILCWPLEPFLFFFGPRCPDGEAGLDRFRGVIELVDLWPAETELFKLFQ